jgi:hypothetical protein
VLAAECTDLLDGMIVNVAAPAISRDLGAGDADPEQAPAALDVAEPGAGDEADGERERVAADHPLQPGRASVDDDKVGSASGTLNAIRQLGGALGVAVLGTLFFSAAPARGFLVAFERTPWVESGVLAATAALVFLLPMRAREEVPA